LLTVTKVTTIGEVVGLLPPAAIRVVQLEGPQKVGGLLELGTDGVDLVDHILNTDDVLLAQTLLDNRVVGQTDALLVDLAEASLVHELSHTLQVRVAPGNVWVTHSQHVDGGLVESDEDGVVDLSQAEQLQALADLW